MSRVMGEFVYRGQRLAHEARRNAQAKARDFTKTVSRGTISEAQNRIRRRFTYREIHALRRFALAATYLEHRVVRETRFQP